MTRQKQENAVEVKPIDATSGREILNSRGRTFGKEEADALVERLGGLPLVSELASAYLETTRFSIQVMLDKIDMVDEISSCKEFKKNTSNRSLITSRTSPLPLR